MLRLFTLLPLELSQEDWDQLIGSNLKGPLFLINGLIDMLKESKRVVINMTDMNVDRGLSNMLFIPQQKVVY